MAFIKPGDEVPPVFVLQGLEDAGVEIQRGEEVSAEYTELSARRRLLLALIKDDGWEWDDLEAGAYDHLIATY